MDLCQDTTNIMVRNFKNKIPVEAAQGAFSWQQEPSFHFGQQRHQSCCIREQGIGIEKGRGQRKRNGILMELRIVFDSCRNSDRKAKAGHWTGVDPMMLQSAEPEIFKEPWIALVLLDVRGTLWLNFPFFRFPYFLTQGNHISSKSWKLRV